MENEMAGSSDRGKIQLPPGLTSEVFDAMIRAIARWEDVGEDSSELAFEIYHIITAALSPTQETKA